MSNTGNFKLILQDITGKDWAGVAEIRILDRHDTVLYSGRGRYRRPMTFKELPANPVSHYRVHVKALFHVPASRFVNVFVDQTKDYEMRLMADWKAADRNGKKISFPKSTDLKGELRPLGEMLSRSPGESPPAVNEEEVVAFAGALDGYDQWISDGRHRLAACLLNLHTKMSHTELRIPGKKDGKGDSVHAWGLAERLIAARQDRIYALLKPAFTKKMDRLLAWLESSPRFDNNPEGFHNVGQPEGFTKHRFTFKTNLPDYGTLQLTFSHNQDRTLWALDADIDEKSGLGHIGEVLLHTVAGVRTSPYAVYELLRRQGLKPPYQLVLEPPPL